MILIEFSSQNNIVPQLHKRSHLLTREHVIALILFQYLN